jgi:hypothetical protein
MEERKKYDEELEISSFASWVIIILFSAAIMAFGWIVYLVVPDAPRYWDFGQLRDTPADSIYSTDEPRPELMPQRQVPALPEAHPLNPVPAEITPRGQR